MKERVFRNVVQCQKLWLTQQLGSLMFNSSTGEIEPANAATRQAAKGANWIPVQLKIKGQGVPHCYLAGKEGRPFNLSEVDAVAAEVATETLQAIDEMIDTHARASLPHVGPVMNRQEAERVLQGQKPGTYMITEADPSLENVAQSLSRTNNALVITYLLTIIGENNRPQQYQICASKWGWTILQDQPDLKNHVYKHHANFNALLETIAPKNKILFKAPKSQQKEGFSQNKPSQENPEQRKRQKPSS